MKLEFAVGMLILAAIAGVLVHCMGGCLPREAKEAIADGAYAEEQLACVDKNEGRERIDACRRAVRIKWGITETGRDAGHD